MKRLFLTCSALLIVALSSFADLYVTDTKWMVEDAENGKNGDYHSVPWLFSEDGNVRAGELWRGVWQIKSFDTVHVVIMDTNTLTDEFDVQFDSPSKFTALKNKSPYRHGILLQTTNKIDCSVLPIRSSMHSAGRLEGEMERGDKP